MAPIIFTSACSFWPWLNHEFFKGRTITIIFVLPGCFMKGNINSHHRLSFLPLIWGFFLPSSSSYFYSHLFLTFSHSVRSDSATPWTAAGQASLSITNSWSLLNSCPSSLWCHPTISSSVAPSPPAFNLSQHQGFFFSESALRNRWPEYWYFSFNINPSNEYSGLVSFRIDWFDFKSLLQ